MKRSSAHREEFATQNLPLKTDPIRAPGTIKNDLQNFKLT